MQRTHREQSRYQSTGGMGGLIKPASIMTPTHDFTGTGGTFMPSNTTTNNQNRKQQLAAHGIDGLKRMIEDLQM